MKHVLKGFITLVLVLSCASSEKQAVVSEAPFVWEAANVYFLLIDRFCNGDTTNDVQFSRTAEPSKLRGFEGGDIKGILKKLEEGYFTKLGVNAIWMLSLIHI